MRIDNLKAWIRNCPKEEIHQKVECQNSKIKSSRFKERPNSLNSK